MDTGLVDRVWGFQETLLGSRYRHTLRQCILLLDSLRFPVYTLKIDVMPQIPIIFLIIKCKNNIDPWVEDLRKSALVEIKDLPRKTIITEQSRTKFNDRNLIKTCLHIQPHDQNPPPAVQEPRTTKHTWYCLQYHLQSKPRMLCRCQYMSWWLGHLRRTPQNRTVKSC